MYFLTLASIEKFHESKIQIGIKNAVSRTKSKLKPSTPSVTFKFENWIHEISSHIWNCVFAGSKRQNRTIDKLNISNDQKREKFLMKLLFVAGVKASTKAPMDGRIVSDNNIFLTKELNNGFEPLFFDYKTNTLTELS